MKYTGNNEIKSLSHSTYRCQYHMRPFNWKAPADYINAFYLTVKFSDFVTHH